VAADDAAAATVGPRGEAWTDSRGRRARWEQATTNIPPEEPLPRTRQILSRTTLSTGEYYKCVWAASADSLSLLIFLVALEFQDMCG
jgi:hypothetical protein